jgi:hypothetical protein
MLTPSKFSSGYTAIPNVAAEDVSVRVQAFIDFFTWECLTEFFGFEISERIAALETEDREAVLTEAEKMLKYYVFSKWIQGNKFLTDNGTVVINSVVGSNVYDLTRVAEVYNRSVELSKSFEAYLVARSDFSDVKCKAKKLLPFFNY